MAESIKKGTKVQTRIDIRAVKKGELGTVVKVMHPGRLKVRFKGKGAFIFYTGEVDVK